MLPERDKSTGPKGIWEAIKTTVEIARIFPSLYVQSMREVWAERMEVLKLRQQLREMGIEAVSDLIKAGSYNERLARFAGLRNEVDNLLMERFVVGKPREFQDAVLKTFTEDAEIAKGKFEVTGSEKDRLAFEMNARLATKIGHYLKKGQ